MWTWNLNRRESLANNIDVVDRFQIEFGTVVDVGAEAKEEIVFSWFVLEDRRPVHLIMEGRDSLARFYLAEYRKGRLVLRH